MDAVAAIPRNGRELMVFNAPVDTLSDDDVMGRLEAAGRLITKRGEVGRVKAW